MSAKKSVLEKPGLSPVLILLLGMLVLALTMVNEAQAAPPAWQASSAIAASNGPDVTVTLPAHATNDILLLQVVVRDVNDTITWPAGWTQIATVDRGTTARYWWAWKRAASNAETNPLVNKNTTNGDTYAAVSTYRGAITTGDPWEVKGTPNTSTAAGHVLNGITTLTAESLIVASLCGENNSAASTTYSATNPTSLAQVLYVESGTSANGACAAGAGARTTTGATGNVTTTWSSTVVGSGGIVLALKPAPPSVTSINRASTDPTEPGVAVSWTVIFNSSVTGVDTTDFTLVQAGGATGASITSVTGSGTTWTVTANTGTGTGTLGLNLVDDDTIIDSGSRPLGGTGAGNGNFTGQVYTVSPPFCTPPSNIPAGVSVSCVCDQFGRASLNPSTIYGANWIVSTSDTTGIVPYINATSGYLRLTENTGNNAKAATVPGIFPAAGNYISVEFQHYAYGSTSNPGADGIAITLSDYAVPAVPGGFGGSLGYAQRTGIVGFAGGWLGVALDEWGNYQNPTEGRLGGPGFIPQSVGARGSGSGMNDYRWLGGTTGLTPLIDNRGSATPSLGYFYQVIVDARNDPTSTSVAVNRDTGGGYTSLINIPNVYTAATGQGFTQAPVPNNWQISFTGSTGGANNIHEIGGLRICAQSVYPPTGGTASGFSAIDEAYPGAPTVPAYPNFQTGHIYMKLMGTSFRLWVAALTSTGISTGYSSVSAKYVSVKLVDNSDNACGPDSARTCNAACTNKTAVEAGATQIATFPSGSNTGVAAPLPTFTLNSAWKNLIAVMKECTTSACAAFTATAPACSTDSFTVRPTSITSTTSSNATNTGTTGTPIFKAGVDNFSLTATAAGIGTNPGGYTGIPKLNSVSVQAFSPATVAGVVAGSFSAATSGTGNSTATGTTFTYSEVGAFRLRGPDFTVPRIPGVYDDNWTVIDSDPLKNDCISGTAATAYSNTKDANGKYGCNFGITVDTGAFGRFTPAYFDATRTHGCPADGFTYAGVMVGVSSSPVGQPFSATATARNAAGLPTQNYHSAYGLAKDTTISNAGNATGLFNNVLTSSTGPAGFINGVATTNTIYYSFAAKETAPATLTLRATDTDNVSSSGRIEETTDARSGRVQIQNAFGSELVDLAVPMRAQFYSTNGWVTNPNDNCTTVTLSFPAFYQNLASGETCVQDIGSPGRSGVAPVTCAAVGPAAEQFREGGVAGFNGDFNLYLKAPGAGNDGGVDVSTDLFFLPWLRYDWDGNGSHDNDPVARATFGIYKGSPRHIYLRERY